MFRIQDSIYFFDEPELGVFVDSYSHSIVDGGFELMS